jgi:hypothetical protein
MAFRTTTIEVKNDAKTWERTPEGYLDITGYATRYGIFDYYDWKGNLKREYRPKDEVFSPESYNTLKLKAHTTLHPDEMLNDTNTTEHLRGVVTQDITPEGEFLKVRVRIYDKVLIELILSGQLTELSCGYTCEIEETPGIFEGQHHDAIQRKIRYNHLSSVPKGRAGPKAKFNIDEHIDELYSRISMIRKDSETDIRFDKNYFDYISQEDSPQMHKITIDGKEYEVSKEVFDAYQEEKKKTDAALSASKKDADTSKGTIAQMQKQLDAFAKEKADAEKDAVIEQAKPFITLDSVDYEPLSIRQVKELALTCQQDADDKTDLATQKDDFIAGMFAGLTRSAPVSTENKGDSSPEAKKNTFDELKKQIKTIAPIEKSKVDGEGDKADKARQEKMKKDSQNTVIGYAATKGVK